MTTDADVLYVNGVFLAMDDTQGEIEALATRGDYILATGSLAEISQLVPEARRVDLCGRVMLPAFIDPHGHFPDTGFISLFRVDLSSPPRGNCHSLADVFAKLTQKAGQTEAGKWIMGVLLNESELVEGRLPTAEELSAISSVHPIWITHASGHYGVGNHLALQIMQFSEAMIVPPGSELGRMDDGRLNGYVAGIELMGEMANTDFLIDHSQFEKGFRAARDEYLSHGVTLAQNAWATRSLLHKFNNYAQSYSLQGDPGIDVMILPDGATLPNPDDPLTAFWPDCKAIRLGPRKLFTDGAFQMQSAFLSQPYKTSMNKDAPYGGAYISQEKLDEAVEKWHCLGSQIHVHANGDAGADMFLESVAKVLARHPRSDHRHTIIHGQTLREDQLDCMQKLGITVSFFTAHVYYWGDMHYDHWLGATRAMRISPAGSASRRAMRYTIHNDAPVTSTRPLELISIAVNRRTLSGRILGEDQKISVEQALKAHTIDAAWQIFLEEERGSLTPGKLAELVILSDNPVEHPELLDDIQVLATIRRGKMVYQAPTS